MDYFNGTSLKIDLPMLRTTSGNQLTEEELVALEAKLSFWAEQYLDKEKKAGISTSFTNPIPKTPVSELEDVIRMANFLRQEWHCGDGPLPCILRLLERKGIKVLIAGLPGDVWGVSTWADKVHPLIVIDPCPGKTTTDRLRFTAAHELAHLLLTFPKDMEPAQIEKLCNMFAGFFLVPEGHVHRRDGRPQTRAAHTGRTDRPQGGVWCVGFRPSARGQGLADDIR